MQRIRVFIYCICEDGNDNDIDKNSDDSFSIDKCYELLEIPYEGRGSISVIDKKYKKMVLIYHPDKLQDCDEEIKNKYCYKFMDIQKARKILTDYLGKLEKSGHNENVAKKSERKARENSNVNMKKSTATTSENISKKSEHEASGNNSVNMESSTEKTSENANILDSAKDKTEELIGKQIACVVTDPYRPLSENTYSKFEKLGIHTVFILMNNLNENSEEYQRGLAKEDVPLRSIADKWPTFEDKIKYVFVSVPVNLDEEGKIAAYNRKYASKFDRLFVCEKDYYFSGFGFSPEEKTALPLEQLEAHLDEMCHATCPKTNNL